MKQGGGFDRLLRKPHFTSRLISIIIDKAHCVKLWGSFRKPYQEIGRITHLLPDLVRFAIVSATLPATVCPDVLSQLRVTEKDLHTIWLSNDHSNIALVVRKMKYPANCHKIWIFWFKTLVLTLLIAPILLTLLVYLNAAQSSLSSLTTKMRLWLPWTICDHGYLSINTSISSGSCQTCHGNSRTTESKASQRAHSATFSPWVMDHAE